jgi:hypothetical protein
MATTMRLLAENCPTYQIVPPKGDFKKNRENDARN